MTDNSFKGIQCWKPDRFSTVINTDAIAIDPATFLATHSPFKNIATDEDRITEDDVLRTLFQRASEDLHTFAVVQGIPGTGKSHLIRWLKERYTAERGGTDGADVVLLIERANNSLRSTLLQIIEHEVFVTDRFKEYRRRLESATATLSESGLEDTLLNNLQVAAREVRLPPDEEPPGIILKSIEYFLLVPDGPRTQLKKVDGPVKRLVSALRGQDDQLERQRSFEFRSEDFIFDQAFMAQWDEWQGHELTKILVKQLQSDPERRRQLAEYLNALLPFAQGRTTAISTDDLKSMFEELRRELRDQHRGLALFIEDITAFTGLDAGLVDVLATQHTGERNREFCRIISVIGVTYGYFRSHFPANLKQRITHHLALNTEGQQECDFLNNEDTLADLAARYLNALRLDGEVLNDWHKIEGADPEHLPNKCISCPYQATCHEAFGAVLPVDGAQPIGLYPFNSRALWKMYQGLDPEKTSRTPRTFLRSVLDYVLSTHGSAIPDGHFPPPPNSMGSEIVRPDMVNPAHLSTLDRQGGPDKHRLESLLVFWGDGTALSKQGNDGIRYVGDLSEDVFDAFGVTFISGEETTASKPTILTPEPTLKKPFPPSKPVKPEPVPQKNKYTDDINTWYDNGKLSYYDELIRRLVDFMHETIDWAAYAIPEFWVETRMLQRYFVVEDQTGQPSSSIYLELPRSLDLAQVFHVLSDRKQLIDDPASLAGATATLGGWLAQEETRIVDFVSEPAPDIPSPFPLTYILVQISSRLACLSGDLTIECDTAQTLLPQLVQSCIKDRTWHLAIEQSYGLRAPSWTNLMKHFNPETVQRFHDDTLLSVALPQGKRSSEIKREGNQVNNVPFIDAATVIDALDTMIHDHWELPQIDNKNEFQRIPVWNKAMEALATFDSYFASAVSSELNRLKTIHQELNAVLGDYEMGEVFDNIDRAMAIAETHNRVIDFERDQELTIEGLSYVFESLSSVLDTFQTSARVPAISSAIDLAPMLQRYHSYLTHFESVLVEELNQVENIVKQIRDELTSAPASEDIGVAYSVLIERLQALLRLTEI